MSAQRSPCELIGKNPRRFLPIVVMSITALAGSIVCAQESNEDQPADPDTGESTIAERTLGVLPNPWTRYGVKFAATSIEEALGNATGGIKQSGLVQGRGTFTVDIDFAKLSDWRGLTGHANLFAIHGDGLSRSNLKNFLVTSGIEALPTVRLYEAYLEQKFFRDKWSIRFGQFAADSEFIATKYTDVFTNASLGWPAITALDLPSGGPSPPLAAVGARLFATLSDNVSALAAVFNGDPAGAGLNDPQQRNRFGLNFRVNDPPLVLSELQVAWKQSAGQRYLPGAFKFGGWRHFGTFSDQRFDVSGLSLAELSASGTARLLRGDHGLYAVFEQRLITISGDDSRGIGVFSRISSSPSDRNLIDLYGDAGIDFLGVNKNRPHDKFGIAFGYARVSKRARQLDADFRRQLGADWPLRSSEALATLSYQYEVQAGWNLLPNAQYILRPGAGASDPLGEIPGRRLRNAAVLSMRSVMKF